MPAAPRFPVWRAALALLFAAVLLLSRYPLLHGGYGSDDDAWRSVVSALHMRESGHYVPSRIPGYPLFEFLLVFLVPFGPFATNLASVLAQLAAADSFRRVAAALHLPAPGTLTAAFAFSAAVWVTATQTMDYAFGLAFLLASYEALLSDHPGAAGALLALAAGCRPSIGLVALPALGYLAAPDRRCGGSTAITFVFAFAAVALALFLPVLARPEARDLAGQLAFHTGHSFDRLGAVRAAVVFLFGKLGAAVLALALLAGILALARRRVPPRGSPRGALGFELFSAGLLGALYLVIPHDPAYLLPALPLILLAAGRLLPRAWVPAVALALASEAVVLPVLGMGHVLPGRLFQELETRRTLLAETGALMADHPASRTVFVLGRFGLMRLLVLDPGLERTAAGWAPFRDSGVGLWTRDHRVGYAAYLEAPERAALERTGYRMVDTTPQGLP